MKLYVLTVLLAVSCGWVSAKNVVVGSYDLGDLDQEKLDTNPDVADVITDVILQYDILLVQGIKNLSVIYQLQEQLWQKHKDGFSADVKMTDPLGVMGDEFFAFFFNTLTVEFVDMMTYPDTEVFMYSPVAASFRLYYGVMDTLFITAVKLDPYRTFEELQELPKALTAVEMCCWSLGNPLDWLIMGKFHTDPRCSNMTTEQYHDLDLQWSGVYWWYIGDTHTTLSDPYAHCAPDRILVRGDALQTALIGNSGFANNVWEVDQELIQKTSDYFPVGVEMYGYVLSSASGNSPVSFWISLPSLIMALPY